MAFQFSERHIEDYHHHGYTVFRGVVPASLVADLRREAGKGRVLARELRGTQVQRLQPLKSYGDRLNLQPFHDYAQLPALNDAVQQVLSPEHQVGGVDWRMGILFEPAESPWCTAWHRDINKETSGLDPETFRRRSRDPNFFCQANCALYTDTSTWYVPGSAARPDLPGETLAAAAEPALEGFGFEEREQRCMEYCRNMPGAIQLVLEAGDYALYRPVAWHIGNYSPYRTRATLHDGVPTPEVKAWYAHREKTHKQRKEQGAANQVKRETALQP